ncbi:MAG: DUF3488 domain-containing transglutaminase family protein, partial [Gammaproteobacteria bacterium]|nr:DUF3488 domain-containing transglutaminase family protein [Gammaproteobacteria bacterium]
MSLSLAMKTANKQHLPIDSIHQELADRTSIFAVCFCFLFSIAAHFFNLPLWVSAIVILALTWRCLQNLGYLGRVNNWLLIPMVLAGGVGVFAEFWTIVGRDAGLALLTVMTSFKVLESRSHRDLLILIFLCYFLIATHFLFSQSVFTAGLMLITLIVITSTLITLNQRNNEVTIKQRLKTSMRLVALSVPIMLILFVLVPRIPGPLWGITNEQRGGITGLSDHMSPGEISNLITSNEVAFRVDFDGAVPLQHQLYWRGPVMVKFNGRRWNQKPRRRNQQLQINTLEASTTYTVTLEPNGAYWLLALDIPTQLVNKSVMTREYQLVSTEKVNDLRRYSMASSLSFQIGLDEESEYLQEALFYPQDSNPKTIAYGKQLAARFNSSEEIVNQVLTMFRQQEYTYTLRPPLLRGDVVDQFLFESRRGFCEHFAGSFALLMRAAGIPSRIVTGYQGGEYNEVGNYLIVRQSDAHAWTEIWLQDKGWVRVDPTAAVSPLRIEQGIDNALADETASFRIQNKNPLFGNLLYSWDNLQHSWNDWVINYDDSKQRLFLRKLDVGIENAGDMIIAMVILLVSFSGLFWMISWYRERPPKPEQYEILFRRFTAKMARHGYIRKESEDSRQYLQRIA